MYIGGPNVFIERVRIIEVNDRIGHLITRGANPVMTSYPISTEMGIVEFPIFV